MLATEPRYPLLYQVNTRVWLTALGRRLARPVTLDDVPDQDLDELARRGFDWVWLLSVWQTGEAGRAVSRSHAGWRHEYEDTLADLGEDDIGGSGFAITGYHVAAALGGDEALARLRERLRQRGVRLMLDFVPNHTAIDHPWVEQHPEFYIAGGEDDLARAPGDWTRVRGRHGERILAHGRDPYFPGWPDTLQLNHANRATQDALLAELVRIAGQCDGLRCDMAMLVLPEVFAGTWGRQAAPFWPRAIEQVRRRAPTFRFLAEVYWDLEWPLQQLGFDYTYDKRLYDRLHAREPGTVRDHLRAGLDFQDRLARFLENHDEPRAATAFPPGVHEAAAVLTYLAPGLRFIHQGQLEGRRKRITPHLVRGPDEPTDSALAEFYDRLLTVLCRPVVRTGGWHLLESYPSAEDNDTCQAVLAFAWEGEGDRLLVVVNYADHPSQCYVRPPFSGLEGQRWQLEDLLSPARHERDGGDLVRSGLFLDLKPWQSQVFSLRP